MTKEKQATCERCGRERALTLCYNTQNPIQRQWMCSECVATVIRPNTVWKKAS